ncbi:MAG: magnesium/cobalt transporter CorA [Planctomycetes bacterium]|jgi:magnesium transporter|nr:magnesium/cobalt transporter CorA [Planctomycetota bacterium]
MMNNFNFFKQLNNNKSAPDSPVRVGDSPGTVSYVGKKRVEKVKIKLIDYDKTDFLEKEIDTAAAAVEYLERGSVTWVNITGVHETKIIEETGKAFTLHPLTQEDITNTTQRPKVDEYDNYLFIVLKIAFYDEEMRKVTIEQFSLILGENYVLTFQEREADILEPLRNRIRLSKGKIRKMGADYLAYALTDAIIDHYFTVLEQFGEDIEEAETILTNHPTSQTLNVIYKLKKELIILRKSIWPIREVISGLERGDYDLITDTTELYLKDVHDHTVQVAETIETFRDMVSGMLDLYMSTVSNRLNEVMKVLTIFSSIFIPLTFIAGVYGMNFDHMPELGWKHGYVFAWGIMISVVVVLLIFFRRKKWM